MRQSGRDEFRCKTMVDEERTWNPGSQSCTPPNLFQRSRTKRQWSNSWSRHKWNGGIAYKKVQTWNKRRHNMWFLLMILLSTVPGANKVTVLNTFYTYEACQPERNRIGFAMAQSYPYENDFIIVCNFRDNGRNVSLSKLPRYGAFFQQSDVSPVTRLTGPP